MVRQVVPHDAVLEHLGHVHELEGEARPVRHRPSVSLGGGAAASVVHIARVHQLQVRAENVVATLAEEACGDGRVDAAAHGDQDGSPRHVSEGSIGTPWCSSS
jgi:hypothetical protein